MPLHSWGILLVAISVRLSFLAASSRWSNSRVLAGFLVTGRTEVPGQGFYAVLLDSEGTEIALWENPA